MTTRTLLPALALLMSAAAVQAADVFPVKAYTKPGEPVIVKFVNGKGDDAKKAVTELGAAAGKLDNLFTPAPAADITGFKILSASGEEQKLGDFKPNADGTVDLSAACPKLKDGGTFFLTWKDATPLVIEVLFNPGRGAADLKRAETRMGGSIPAEYKAQFSPAATHMLLAEYAQITTDKGVIKARFSYDSAPHTVDNFISLSRQNFYDASAFHRIMTGFMIQGGDGYANVPEQAGSGGPGYEINHEFSDKKHLKGTLSMARSPQGERNPMGGEVTTQFDTAGSQFFIMHGANDHLDGAYSAFGDVFEGMDIVDAIAKTPVSDDNGKVKGPLPKIVSIKILPATPEIYGLKK